MSVDSGLVGARANLQDIVVSFLRHAPRAKESITAPPSGRPRTCWQRSNSHFVAVNVISAWEKWGPISHPLVLAGDLMRVFEGRAVDGLVQNSGPPLLNLPLGGVNVVLPPSPPPSLPLFNVTFVQKLRYFSNSVWPPPLHRPLHLQTILQILWEITWDLTFVYQDLERKITSFDVI